MAPGIPTGPGEGVRQAGAFPGLLIQTEDKDYRGLKCGPPGGGPPFVGPPFTGALGSGSGGGPDQISSSYQNETGLFSGPSNAKRDKPKLSLGTQPGQGRGTGGVEAVGQLQNGVHTKEAGAEKVRESVNINMLHHNNIPREIRSTKSLTSLSPLMPDSFRSICYRYVKLGPNGRYIRFRLCADTGSYYNVLPLAIVEKYSMNMNSNHTGLTAMDVNGGT